jgi:hypothetical protein
MNQRRKCCQGKASQQFRRIHYRRFKVESASAVVLTQTTLQTWPCLKFVNVFTKREQWSGKGLGDLQITSASRSPLEARSQKRVARGPKLAARGRLSS